MIKKKNANEARLRRHRRVRKKVSGTGARPRLSVFRSNNQIYAQVVDDERMTTLVAASSRDQELAELAKAVKAAKPAEAKASAAASPAAETTAAEPAATKGAGKGKGDAKGQAKGSAAASEDAGEPAEKTDKLAPIANNKRVAQARLVGRLIAQRARAKGIEKVVFDRGGYLYHGRVAALAAGAREGGLDF